MLEGLMPAMVTPFDGRGEPDSPAMERIMDSFVEAGVSGVVVAGSTGEFTHLSGAEHRELIERAITAASGRMPVVAGVGASGTREAVSLTRHACRAGADAVICVAPFYWKVGEEALFRHFAAVAEASEVPVIVYNFPALTGIDLSPALIGRICRELPAVAGVKDTVTEYSHTVRVIQEVKPHRPDFAVLAGFEDQILPSLIAGADGAISGLANVAPSLLVELVGSARDGELENAASLHRRVLSLLRLTTLSDPPIGAFKAAIGELGVPVSPEVRGPAMPMPETNRGLMKEILKESGLL